MVLLSKKFLKSLVTFIKPNILSKSDLKISVKVARSRKRWQVLFLVHYLLSVFKKTKKSQMRQKTKTIFQFCKKIWKIYAFVFVPLLFSSKCQEKLNFVCKLLKQKRRKKKQRKNLERFTSAVLLFQVWFSISFCCFFPLCYFCI